MKPTKLIILIALIATLVPALTSAQVDSVGVLDTVYAEITNIDNLNWSVTLSCMTDAEIVGLSIPFKISAGLNRIVADSIKYTERVDKFAYKNMRADTVIQCVTIGLLGSLGGPLKTMSPGSGAFAIVYISSMEQKEIEALSIDTTTTHPNNTLMMAASLFQGTPPNNYEIPNTSQKIVPAWVIRKSKK